MSAEHPSRPNGNEHKTHDLDSEPRPVTAETLDMLFSTVELLTLEGSDFESGIGESGLVDKYDLDDGRELTVWFIFNQYKNSWSGRISVVEKAISGMYIEDFYVLEKSSLKRYTSFEDFAPGMSSGTSSSTVQNESLGSIQSKRLQTATMRLEDDTSSSNEVEAQELLSLLSKVEPHD